jgi:ketosteroid isomerase-like protein
MNLLLSSGPSIADFDPILRLSTGDVQSVDEVSRAWLRGRTALEGYVRSLADRVSNVESHLAEIQTIELGDVAILATVLQQSYDLAGQRISIVAPTTVVLRRIDGDWQVALSHSVRSPMRADPTPSARSAG